MFVYRQHPDGPQHAHQPVPTAGDAGFGERHRPGHQEHGELASHLIVHIVPIILSTALQRINTENWKQIIPEKELRGHSPNFHIHVSGKDLYLKNYLLRNKLRFT